MAEQPTVKDIVERDHRIAELQRLCERVVIVLEEDWDKLTDKEGYGPVNLLRYLKEAAKGKELRDIRAFADRVIKVNQSLEQQLAELRAAITSGKVSDIALDELRNRKGFRRWWDDLDCDIQLDVQSCINKALNKALNTTSKEG